jgi:hypothetical protein
MICSLSIAVAINTTLGCAHGDGSGGAVARGLGTSWMGEKPNFLPFACTGLPKSDSPRALFFGLVFMKGFSVYVESVDRV